VFNPLIPTLKPQLSNGPSLIGTLAVDGWARTTRRGGQ